MVAIGNYLVESAPSDRVSAGITNLPDCGFHEGFHDSLSVKEVLEAAS